METVCETCGDRGFEEALVYCSSCKTEAIHRYCIGITPVPFTEYITWICEDCNGSDGDFDFKEVGQTAKFTHILMKSSNHTPPNLTPPNLTPAITLSNHTPPNLSLECDYKHYCTTKKRKSSSRNAPFTCENKQLADGNSSCKEVAPNTSQMFGGLASRHYRARPVKTPVWRGTIFVQGGNARRLIGIVAHTSNLACPKVHEMARSLQVNLSAEKFPRLEIWPKNFLKNGGPKDESIALFFFPSSESIDENAFYSLVLEMKNNDLAMRCVLDEAELLLFTSYMLPVGSWTSNSNGYLWGVFKRKQTS